MREQDSASSISALAFLFRFLVNLLKLSISVSLFVNEGPLKDLFTKRSSVECLVSDQKPILHIMCSGEQV